MFSITINITVGHFPKKIIGKCSIAPKAPYLIKENQAIKYISEMANKSSA